MRAATTAPMTPRNAPTTVAMSPGSTAAASWSHSSGPAAAATLAGITPPPRESRAGARHRATRHRGGRRWHASGPRSPPGDDELVELQEQIRDQRPLAQHYRDLTESHLRHAHRIEARARRL